MLMLYLLHTELDGINPQLEPLHVNEESPSLGLSHRRISRYKIKQVGQFHVLKNVSHLLPPWLLY